MQAPSKRTYALGILLPLLLAGPPDARAGLQLATRASEVGGVHFSDWGSAGTLGTTIPGPFTVTASDGTRVTLSSVATHGLSESAGGLRYDYLGGTGPVALEAASGGSEFLERIEVVFDFDSPVQAFGVDLIASARRIDSRVRVEARGAGGTLLGAFVLAAGSTNISPAFFEGYAGVVSDSADIRQVRFSAQAAGSATFTGRGSVAIKALDVAAPAAVPEPSTFALVAAAGAVGALARAASGRMRKRAG